MKEAIAWHYHGLFVLGLMAVAWLGALTVAARTTTRMKALPRAVIVGAVAVSFPAYIAFGMWRAEYSPNSLKGNQRLRFAGVQEQTALYKKLCASGPALAVKRAIELPTPTSIAIEEQPEDRLGHALRLTQPRHPATSVCWLDQPTDPCPSSNLRQVEFKEWVYPDSRRCEAGPGFRSAAKCVEQVFRYDRQSQKRIRVEPGDLQSRYILAVSAAEELGPQVIRFSVSIKDRDSGEVLASTQLLKRIIFGDMPFPLADEPPHCPPRDAHIAELLSKVFPAVKQ